MSSEQDKWQPVGFWMVIVAAMIIAYVSGRSNGVDSELANQERLHPHKDTGRYHFQSISGAFVIMDTATGEAKLFTVQNGARRVSRIDFIEPVTIP